MTLKISFFLLNLWLFVADGKMLGSMKVEHGKDQHEHWVDRMSNTNLFKFVRMKYWTEIYNEILFAIESIWVRTSRYPSATRFNKQLSKRWFAFFFFGGCPALICTRSTCVAFSSPINFCKNNHSVGWAHPQYFIRTNLNKFVLLMQSTQCSCWIFRAQLAVSQPGQSSFLRMRLCHRSARLLIALV